MIEPNQTNTVSPTTDIKTGDEKSQDTKKNSMQSDPSVPTHQTFDLPAFDIVYSRAIDEGYYGTQTDFFNLMCTSEEAVGLVYDDAVSQGYNGKLDDFRSLIGITEAQNNLKKKSELSDSSDGPSQLDTTDEYKKYRYDQAVKALKEARPDLNFPTKEEYYKDKTAPELRETTVYKDAYDMSAGEKKAIKQGEANLMAGVGDDEYYKAFSGSFKNMANQLSTVDDYMKFTAGVLMNEFSEPGEYKDKAMRYIAEASKEIDKMKGRRAPVAALIDPKTGDFKDLSLMTPFAIFDGISAVGTSILISKSTGGVGLAAQMIGESIKDFNEVAAKAKGTTVEDLYSKGEAEIVTPALIGAAAFSLEKIGQNVLLGKAFKGIPNKIASKVADGLFSVYAEGKTEEWQYYAEELNKYVASRPELADYFKGDNPDFSMKDDEGMKNWWTRTYDNPQSRENFWKGIAGGGGVKLFQMSTPDRDYEAKLTAGLKTKEQRDIQNQATEAAQKTQEAQNGRELTDSERQAFNEAYKIHQERITEVQREVEDLASKLTPEQSDKVVELFSEQERLNGLMVDVVGSKNLTEEQKTVVINELRKEFDKAGKEIDSIRKEALEGKEVAKGFKVKEVKPIEEVEATRRDKKQEEQEQVEKPEEAAFTTTEQLTELEQKIDSRKEPGKISVIQRAKRAIEALEKEFGDLKMVIHENKEDFANESQTNRQDGMGAFNPNQSRIHINLENADGTTVPHEVFHGLLKKTFGTDQEIQRITKSLVDDLEAFTEGTELGKTLSSFINSYDKKVKDEEYVTQLFSIFAEYGDQMKPNTRQRIKQFINEIAKYIGKGRIFDDADIRLLDVQQVINTLSQKVAEGETITRQDVQKLDPVVRETLAKGEDVEQGRIVGEVEIPQDEVQEKDTEIKLQLKDRKGINVDDVVRGSYNDLKEMGIRSVFAMAADRASVGTVNFRGKDYKMMGGPLYMYLKQGAWAFTDLGAAQSVLSKAKATDGVALIMLQGETGILGNAMTYDVVVDQFRSAVADGKVDEQSLVDFINKKLQSKKQSRDFMESNDKQPVKSIDDFNEVLRDATYDIRSPFFESLLGGKNSKNPEIKKQFPDLFTTRDLLDSFNDPAFIDNEYGDLVAAVQFDKESDIIDTRETEEFETHPSYPFIIKGNPVMVFNNPVDVRNVFGDFVSSSGRKLGDAERKDVGAFTAMRAQPKGETGQAVEELSEVRLQVSPETKKKNVKAINDQFKKNAEALKKMEATANKKTRTFGQRFQKQWFDRLFIVRSFGMKAKKQGIKEASEFLANLSLVAGVPNFAGAKNAEYVSNTTGLWTEDLGITQQQFLQEYGQLAMNERVIAINEFRKSKPEEYAKEFGNEAYRIGVITEEAARDWIEDQSSRLPLKALETVRKAVDNVFDNMQKELEEDFQAGLIDEDTFDRFDGVRYIPIRIIKEQMGVEDDNLTVSSKAKEMYGVSGDVMKKLSNANDYDIFINPEYLMSLRTSAGTYRRKRNEVIKSFAALVQKKGGKVEDIAVIDKENAPRGYEKVVYFNDGKREAIFTTPDVATELFDADGIRRPGKIAELILGTAVLRSIATVFNPLFVTSAVAMDVLQTVYTSNTYDVIRLGKNFNVKLLSVPNAVVRITTNMLRDGLSALGADPSYKAKKARAIELGMGMDILNMGGTRTKELSTQFKVKKGNKWLPSIGTMLGAFATSADLANRIAVMDITMDRARKEYQKKYKKEPRGKDALAIERDGASAGRNTMDFSQGGRIAKIVDAWGIPYFNATMLGVRKFVDFTMRNPVAFIGSMTQAGLFGYGMGYTSKALIARLLEGEEDDEEVNKKLREFRSQLSAYEKANYFTFPTSYDGKEFTYIRIRRLPILNVFDTIGEELFYESHAGGGDVESVTQAALTSIPFTPYRAVGGNPFLNMAFAYAGYDLYRMRPIDNPFDSAKSPSRRALDDENIPDFYKDFAIFLEDKVYTNLSGAGMQTVSEMVRLSPKQLRGMTEAFITSPRVNPLVGGAYTMTEAINIALKDDSDKTYMDAFIKNVNLATERVVRKSSRRNASSKAYKESRDKNWAMADMKADKEREFLDAASKMDPVKITSGALKGKLPQEAIKEIKRIYADSDVDEIKNFIKKYLSAVRTALSPPRVSQMVKNSDYEGLFEYYAGDVDEMGLHWALYRYPTTSVDVILKNPSSYIEKSQGYKKWKRKKGN